jgi:hypothetical protein
MSLQWKIGVEIELLAPVGKSRLHLAKAYADLLQGSIRPFFHPDAEPSKVPGQKLFYNLTPAFEICDSEGRGLLRLLDDITLQSDLNRAASPQPGWYRLLSDDPRLLRLVARHSNPALPIEESLRQVGDIFGTEPQLDESGLVRLTDLAGASIAMAAPLPGERERPCEVVTCPLEQQQSEFLSMVLQMARELDFQIPQEGAVHLHFDAKPLQNPKVLTRLVRLLSFYRLWLRRLMKTNPRCRRLGGWAEELTALLLSNEMQTLTWEQLCERLAEPALLPKLTKYCDFNLKNLFFPPRGKETLEIRILPVTLEVEPLLEAAALFEAMLVACCELEKPLELTGQEGSRESVQVLFDWLPLEESMRKRWLERWKQTIGE